MAIDNGANWKSVHVTVMPVVSSVTLRLKAAGGWMCLSQIPAGR